MPEVEQFAHLLFLEFFRRLLWTLCAGRERAWIDALEFGRFGRVLSCGRQVEFSDAFVAVIYGVLKSRIQGQRPDGRNYIINVYQNDNNGTINDRIAQTYGVDWKFLNWKRLRNVPEGHFDELVKIAVPITLVINDYKSFYEFIIKVSESYELSAN